MTGPIHGVDVSRYQGLSAIDGEGFVIVNVEDPSLTDKVIYARQLGVPWGLYTWNYPGNGRADMARAAAAGAMLGDPPAGYWIDWEQNGVSPGDLSAALDRAAELGILDRTGVYTYLAQIADVAGTLRGRPLWLAYYPGRNDGTYPTGQDGEARTWGAVLWQYTSSAAAAAGLDRNVVIDETWWNQWIGGTSPNTGGTTAEEDDDMKPVIFALPSGEVFEYYQRQPDGKFVARHIAAGEDYDAPWSLGALTGGVVTDHGKPLPMQDFPKGVLWVDQDGITPVDIFKK